MSGTDDTDRNRRNYKPPHSARHPIPTIQQYRDFKQKERDELQAESAGDGVQDVGQWSNAKQSAKDYWYGPKQTEQKQQGDDPSPRPRPQPSTSSYDVNDHDGQEMTNDSQQHDTKANEIGVNGDGTMPDTSQSMPTDPKAKRRQFKHHNAESVEREVTDPVTHLPVKIHDFSEKDFKERLGDSDEEDGGDRKQSVPGLQDCGKTQSGIDRAAKSLEKEHKSMEKRFPPPSFNLAQSELANVHRRSILYGMIPLLAGAFTFGVLAFITPDSFTLGNYTFRGSAIMGVIGISVALISAGMLWLVSEWSQIQVRDIWEDAVWQARHDEIEKDMSGGTEETTLWLSKLVGSIWPMINPDLFTSVADTLEDIMQASLPKLVRMVSVDDLGQGSESLQILGINWLPKGAAGRSVTENGELTAEETDVEEAKSKDATEKANSDAGDDTEQGPGGDAVSEGMEAEEGEFVNLELAFAYRAGRLKSKLKDRAKNAHLYLAFYLPGNIKLPVWVELKALIGICRLRLQLAPDPPFVQLCTLTFLGQPRVNIKCMPLIKKGLNIMDLPLISNFVQSSVNAALSEYVAPKSITLDLQAMLAGDDFKRDTTACGILVVRIKRAYDFKAGDVGLPLVGNDDSSDPYVSVGWAKFGKPLWSTRVIEADMTPYWEEQCQVLVGPEELDADENLRLSLYDSDKISADDDLGRIELGLKDLMRNEKSNGKMWDRSDAFRAVEAGESMPGRCDWAVGYYSKTRLLKSQMEQQKKDKNIESIDQLREETYKSAKRKIREATQQNESEVRQIQQDDWEALQTHMISDSLPPEEYPSGILSVQIHQCIGLQLEKLNRSGKDIPDGEQTDLSDDSSALPDGYCTVVLNHQKVFKTRTKPKNAAPFFNACTERYIGDWRSTELELSVRDARVHEDDPLLGFVHIDLGKLFRERRTSHINEYFPLAGGIGYGRLRVSIVFRSIQLQNPARALGWNLGTLEIGSDIYGAEGVPKDLQNHHLKLSTPLAKGRMQTNGRRDSYDHAGLGADSETRWSTGKDRAQLLPVERRYATNLCIQFRSGAGIFNNDKTPAAAILWLCTIPDEVWTDVTVPVWRTDKAHLKRLRANQLPDEKCGEKIGVLRFKVRFWRGLGTGHVKSLAKRDADVRNVVEVLKGARDHGLVGPMVGDSGWRQAREKQSTDRSAAAASISRDDDGHDEDADTADSSDENGDDQPSNGHHQAESESQSGMEDTKGTRDVQHHRHSSDNTKENTTPPRSTTSDHPDGTPSPNNRDDSISISNASTTSKGSGIIGATKDYIHNSSSLHRRHRGIMQWKGARTVAWMKHKADKGTESVKEKFEHKGREPGVETEV